MQPKITVIIPSFNHERFLKDAVNSVLSQTFSEIEVVIVDDCSSDNSRDVILGIKDPRVRHIFLPENTGGCNVLNLGIKSANSDLVAICNSDDEWQPDKLEKQEKIIRNSEIAAVFSAVSIIDSTGKPLVSEDLKSFDVFNQPNRSKGQWLKHLIEFGNCLCHPSILIRKRAYDVCGNYNDFYRQLPDYDMWLRLIQEFNIYVHSEPLVNFRVLDKGANTSAPTKENLRRTANEKKMIFQSVFDSINASTFQHAFGTLKAISDPSFCLEAEKFLYLVSPLRADSMRRTVAYELLGRFAKNVDSWGRLKAYDISLGKVHAVAGADSPWLRESNNAGGSAAASQAMQVPDSALAIEIRKETVQKYYQSLLHSFSWRVAKGLRDAKQQFAVSGPENLSAKPSNPHSDGFTADMPRVAFATLSSTVVEDRDNLFDLMSSTAAIEQSNSWRLTKSLRQLKLDRTLIDSCETNRSGASNLSIFVDMEKEDIVESAYEEVFSLLEHFEGQVHLEPLLGKELDKRFYGKRLRFKDGLNPNSKLAYFMTYGAAETHFSYLQENNVPFVFNLSPSNSNAGDEECIRKLCSSKLFKCCFVPNAESLNFLLGHNLCAKSKILQLASRPLPMFFETTSWSERQLFSIQKQTLDIGFVVDDATDVLLECQAAQNFLELLRRSIPEIRACLIGSPAAALRCEGIGTDVEFIDFRIIHSAVEARQIFTSLDVVMSLNASKSSHGKYSTFPHFDCIAAGLSGAAVFSTDFANKNEHLQDEIEIALLDGDLEHNAKKVLRFLRNPMLLHGLGFSGRTKFRSTFGWSAQMGPKIELVRKLLG